MKLTNNLKIILLAAIAIGVLALFLYLGYERKNQASLNLAHIQTPSPPLSISTPSATPTPTATPGIDTEVYYNTSLKFSLTFPDKDWYLPSVADNDPHFYANAQCVNSERFDCPALEIQNYDNDKEFLKGWETMFNTLKADGQNPVKLSSLIPGAIVIKSNAPGPAEGWSYEYDIFFQTTKRQFLIFTNDETLEKDIIPTFRLTN